MKKLLNAVLGGLVFGVLLYLSLTVVNWYYPLGSTFINYFSGSMTLVSVVMFLFPPKDVVKVPEKTEE